MKIRLLQPARINYNAGDVVEASPEQACFLLSVGGAEPVEKVKETITTKAAEEKIETPEAKKPEIKKAVRKTAKK